MKQISPYYLFYIKGATLAKSNSPIKLRQATEYLEKALNFKETETAFNQLAISYMKLNDSNMYEQTINRGARAGFKLFYSSCGIFYANDKDKFDEKTSLKWFNKGIESKDPKSYSDLAKLYVSGCKAFKADYEKAEILLQQGLSLKDPRWNGYFCWSLGLICYEKKQYELAANCYERAIKYGYMPASFYLALMYRDGIGVEKDPEKYMEYIMMYLSPESALEIAGIYLTNQYAPVDEDVAFMYFDYAANRGNAVAAIMCAAFLVERKSNSETQLNRYLEIAFRNGINDENMQSHFDEIEETLGENVGKTLKDLAEKYWNMRRSEA